MIDIKIEGLVKFEKLPDKIQSEIELELREAAEKICTRARELCKDPILGAQINYRIYHTRDTIGVEITGPFTTKSYLLQAFNEHKSNFKDYISQAIERAIKA